MEEELLYLSCDEPSLYRERVDIFMGVVAMCDSGFNLTSYLHREDEMSYSCDPTSRYELAASDPNMKRRSI